MWAVVEIDVPEILAQALPTAVALIAYEARVGMAQYLAEQNTGVGPAERLSQVGANTRAMFARFPVPQLEEYQAALRTRIELRAAMQQYFADHALDALMFPPTPTPAPLQGDHTTVEICGVQVPIVDAMGSKPAVGSVGGLASLVLPPDSPAAGCRWGWSSPQPAAATGACCRWDCVWNRSSARSPRRRSEGCPGFYWLPLRAKGLSGPLSSRVLRPSGVRLNS